MKKNKELYRKNASWLISLVLLLVFYFMSNLYLEKKKNRWEKNVRSSIQEVLIGKKSQLEKSLYSRIYYTRGIAAYVSFNPDIENSEYYELAKEFIGGDSVINSMALSKNCIINAVYPLKGHEDAIGLNLLAHEERRDIVEKTIKTQKTFVAGPVELVEGGSAFISYTPIFDKTGVEEQFWGMTDIVIKRNAYLKSAGMLAQENGLQYSLRGQDGKGVHGDVFFGDPTIFDKNPVLINIELPYGNWVLGAMPVNGWSTLLSQDDVLKVSLYLVSLLVVILVWFLLRYEYRIREKAKELNALLNSLHNVILEYDMEGKCLKVAAINQELLLSSPHNLENKTVYELYESELAELMHEKIRECAKIKQLVVFDYQLLINGVNKWFEGRLSYMSENRVILSAYDITDKKNYERDLKKSNDLKDKVFSILAHDLRNPIGSWVGLLESLIENITLYDQPMLIKNLEALQRSGENTLGLLENLLDWAKAKKGILKISKQNVTLESICNTVSEHMESTIKEKNLHLHVSVDKELKVNTDAQILNTIIRNLLSNAVKFSHPGGHIYLNAFAVKDRVEIRVCDEGVGMDSEHLKVLFNFGVRSSEKGTNNESGSGLGLVLCKELIDLIDADIRVESELTKGTTFYVLLPKGI